MNFRKIGSPPLYYSIAPVGISTISTFSSLPNIVSVLPRKTEFNTICCKDAALPSPPSSANVVNSITQKVMCEAESQKSDLPYPFLNITETEINPEELSFTSDPIANFMLGYEDPNIESSLKSFFDPLTFYSNLKFDSLFAFRLFPTASNVSNLLLCPVVTAQTRWEFSNNYHLRSVHRRIADFAFAAFGLRRVDNSISVLLTFVTNPPVWAKPEGHAQRVLLKQIATSLFLLGNRELAKNLCSALNLLLTHRDLPEEAKEFANLEELVERDFFYQQTGVMLGVPNASTAQETFIQKQQEATTLPRTVATAVESKALSSSIALESLEKKQECPLPIEENELPELKQTNLSSIQVLSKKLSSLFKTKLKICCEEKGLNPEMYQLITQKMPTGGKTEVLTHKAYVLYPEMMEMLRKMLEDFEKDIKDNHTHENFIETMISTMADERKLSPKNTVAKPTSPDTINKNVQDWIRANLDNPDYGSSKLCRIFNAEDNVFVAEYQNGTKVEFSNRKAKTEFRGDVLKQELMSGDYQTLREILMKSYLTVRDCYLKYSAFGLKSAFYAEPNEQKVSIIFDAMSSKKLAGVPLKDLWEGAEID